MDREYQRFLSSGLAGANYFVLVFALGFVFGLIRIPILVPLVGELNAVAMELPVILVLSWLLCSKVTRWHQVSSGLVSRLLMGMIALSLLLTAEICLSVLVFGNSIADHFYNYRTLPNSLGLAGQVLFGLFPFIQTLFTNPSDEEPMTH